MNPDKDRLPEKQLLPILQFMESLLLIMRDHKHRFHFDVEYDSEEKTVIYKFDIDMKLGVYKASIVIWYDETGNDAFKNNWEDLRAELSHIQQIITT